MPTDHEAFMQAAAKSLKDARLTMDVTQEEVAEIFGYKKMAISNMESGTTDVSLYNYLKIIWFLRHKNEDHPALPLCRALLATSRRGAKAL